jgi:hypothetical protein
LISFDAQAGKFGNRLFRHFVILDIPLNPDTGYMHGFGGAYCRTGTHEGIGDQALAERKGGMDNLPKERLRF